MYVKACVLFTIANWQPLLLNLFLLGFRPCFHILIFILYVRIVLPLESLHGFDHVSASVCRHGIWKCIKKEKPDGV